MATSPVDLKYIKQEQLVFLHIFLNRAGVIGYVASAESNLSNHRILLNFSRESEHFNFRFSQRNRSVLVRIKPGALILESDMRVS